MRITPEIRQHITEDLLYELDSKLDGGRRNVLVRHCPFCSHDGYKFAVYVGETNGSKTFGMSNCFSCNRRYRTLKATLEAINLEKLLPKETAELDDEDEEFASVFADEIDDELIEIDMPRGYKRCFRNDYLKSRGWIFDDYEYFPVGTNRGFDYKLSDYVIVEVIDSGRRVGYIGRSTLSKDEIEELNARRHNKILRYRNSNEQTGNGFSKMLYNYDAIEPMKTFSVILCEGVFDVVALTRKLELYDNKSIVPVATFGKKVSQEQMYKLQKKGVTQVIIGYDNDAKETTARVGMELESYFDVLVADIPNGMAKDWDEMDVEDIYDIFAHNLKTVREFNLD